MCAESGPLSPNYSGAHKAVDALLYKLHKKGLALILPKDVAAAQGSTYKTTRGPRRRANPVGGTWSTRREYRPRGRGYH